MCQVNSLIVQLNTCYVCPQQLGALDRSLNVWHMSVFFARQGKFSKE